MTTADETYRENLIARINRKDWWHVTPADPKSYSRRGKFLASTYREAEFWGRPNDMPERVTVKNPLIGDEETIEITLLGCHESKSWPDIDEDIASGKPFAERRYALDAKLYEAARVRGYDAIVLLSRTAYAKFIAAGKIPLSIELNLLREDSR